MRNGVGKVLFIKVEKFKALYSEFKCVPTYL